MNGGGDRISDTSRLVAPTNGLATLQPFFREKKKSFSSFSHVSIVQCTPDTNVVLLLRHLGRNADADLVEPLVTAAVTLDPIHLKDARKLLMTFILNIANI